MEPHSSPIQPVHKPSSQSVFGLGSEFSKVMVMVITVSWQLRHWSMSCLCRTHDQWRLLPWPIGVKCGFTITLKPNPSVTTWRSPSHGSVTRLFEGHGHHYFAVRSAFDDCVVYVGLLNVLAVMNFWSPPHHMLYRRCWRLLYNLTVRSVLITNSEWYDAVVMTNQSTAVLCVTDCT